MAEQEQQQQPPQQQGGQPGVEALSPMSEGENDYEEQRTVKGENEDEKMTGTDQPPAATDSGNNQDANGEAKKKFDPKDPTRPRRKKARRACYACQRAHLTCGKIPCIIQAALAAVPPPAMFNGETYGYPSPPAAMRFSSG